MSQREDDNEPDALTRIADALETMAKPLDSKALQAEALTLKGDTMALMSTLKVGGENIGAILDDESLNLMEKHQALRTLSDQMVKFADRHKTKIEKQA